MTAHPALRITRDEHGAVFAVMRFIDMRLSDHRRHATPMDFTVLQAMLFYVNEFLENVHHRKESELLFPKLRERSTELVSVLDRLEEDHARSHDAVRELEQELLALEIATGVPNDPSRLARFERLTTQYIASYLEHTYMEESLVLPMAERVLTTVDWAELDAAYLLDSDRLMECHADDTYHPLFNRILMSVSPPGLGRALEAIRVSYAGAHTWPTAP